MEKVLIDTIEIYLDINSVAIKNMFESHHEQSCCEEHYLDFDSWESDFKEAEERLTKIDKIEIYWEEWMGITVFFYDWEERVWIFIPWRGYNNWYYSSNLKLILTLPDWFVKRYDISEYQDYLI